MHTTTRALVLLGTLTVLSMIPAGLSRRIWSLKVSQVNNMTTTKNTTKANKTLNAEQVNEKMGLASLLFEGDIFLTKEQRMILEEDESVGKKQAWRSAYTKWSRGVVPYVLDRSLSSRAQGAIYQAMQEIKQQTGGCVSFKKRTNEADYVRFFSGSGCWSYVGRIGGRQDISINNFGCASKGTAMHEIFHALGRFHEQNRADRDQYVNININNVKFDNRHNFKIRRNAEDHSQPYDFTSIMHYGPYDFAINRRIPVITAKRDSSIRIGQTDTLSTKDIAHLKKAYCNGGGGGGGGNGNDGGWSWWSSKK